METTYPFRLIIRTKLDKVNTGGFISIGGVKCKVTSIQSVKVGNHGVEVIGKCKEVKKSENPNSQSGKNENV